MTLSLNCKHASDPTCTHTTAHGGKLWGENNADGKGATFGFSLSISSL